MIAYLKNCVKNLDFEKYKDKLKPLGIAAVCFIAVFAAGFGVGKSSQSGGVMSPTKRSNNTNYNTNTGTEAKDNTTNTNTKPANTNSKTTAAIDQNNCPIKGSKSKIYHVPGGAFYNRTTPAACFNTEEEAQAAGYTKSSR